MPVFNYNISACGVSQIPYHDSAPGPLWGLPLPDPLTTPILDIELCRCSLHSSGTVETISVIIIVKLLLLLFLSNPFVLRCCYLVDGKGISPIKCPDLTAPNS